MAADEVREGLQLVANGLEGLEQGRPLTDEQRWLLLKAIKGLQDADRAMRVKLSQMGATIPPLGSSVRAAAREHVVAGLESKSTSPETLARD
ncbi:MULTISPECIES: hypothetical protein [unclassified Nocardioides]|uniref:hypothetical protein n=1 Tax=unclassified Nocardioides TaxID=2615069 RepID=UPI00070288B9|nr:MULTISPECIES: hypothetical protein [unclassified Nocardioides]KRC59628.1 hypothetical protein ASE19_00980 [Nocardioides sp. Root79]KRC68547.1 hypothetical protein ASE20_16980 [Nocardioides sp. Root240]